MVKYSHEVWCGDFGDISRGLRFCGGAGGRVVAAGGGEAACFNSDWNLARVISRGVETLRVESKVTIDALTLRIR